MDDLDEQTGEDPCSNLDQNTVRPRPNGRLMALPEKTRVDG